MKVILALSLFVIYLFGATAVHAHGAGVHMTKDGFVPNELTIDKGETVVFENVEKDLEFWPASDIHPTHAIYPEFDPKMGIKPGSSWEFTFNRVGEWKFHDHLFPKFTGVIKVKGSEDLKKTKEDKSLGQLLKNTLNDFKLTLARVYFKIFPKKLDEVNISKIVDDEPNLVFYIKLLGPKESMNKLLTESGGGGIYDCHRQAHIIGRISYELYGAEVFGKGNSSCHSGYYHGAMESFLHEAGTNGLSKKIEDVCSVFATNYTNFECLHGVGHGVMAYEDYDLPKAIDVCGEIGDDFAKFSCYGGVFMENIVASTGNASVVGHETKWVSSDPQYPCNLFNDNLSAQRECYMMQTSRMLTIFDYDFEKVSKECLNAPPLMIQTCYQSYGRDVAGNVLRDPDKIIEKCGFVPEKYKYNCYSGAHNVIVEFWGDKLTDQGEVFCNKLDGVFKSRCLEQNSSRMKDIFQTLEVN